MRVSLRQQRLQAISRVGTRHLCDRRQQVAPRSNWGGKCPLRVLAFITHTMQFNVSHPIDGPAWLAVAPWYQRRQKRFDQYQNSSSIIGVFVLLHTFVGYAGLMHVAKVNTLINGFSNWTLSNDRCPCRSYPPACAPPESGRRPDAGRMVRCFGRTRHGGLADVRGAPDEKADRLPAQTHRGFR